MLADILLQLLNGLLYTTILFFVTLILALPLGLVVCFGEMSKFKPLQYLMKLIILIMRGTPLMLQILLVSMIPYYLFQTPTKNLAAALHVSIPTLLFIFVCIAFIINYACYFAEIFRAGIESIDKGQYEAGEVLQMSKKDVFFKVILLQVVKRTVPPLSNEIITLVKDTSLSEVLGVVELLSAANHAVNQYVVLTPLLYAGLFYLAFNAILTFIFAKLEKKLKYFEG